MTHLARPQQDIPDRTRPGADREAPPGTEKKRPLPDPRYVALRNFALSISVLNILGYTVLGFEQPWLWPLAAVAAAYATEILLEWLTAWSERRPTRFGGGSGRSTSSCCPPTSPRSRATCCSTPTTTSCRCCAPW